MPSGWEIQNILTLGCSRRRRRSCRFLFQGRRCCRSALLKWQKTHVTDVDGFLVVVVGGGMKYLVYQQTHGDDPVLGHNTKINDSNAQLSKASRARCPWGTMVSSLTDMSVG